MKNNRRTPEGYALRVYMDAVADAKKISDEEWLAMWLVGVRPTDRWVSREIWIRYLEGCALVAAARYAEAMDVYMKEVA